MAFYLHGGHDLIGYPGKKQRAMNADPPPPPPAPSSTPECVEPHSQAAPGERTPGNLLSLLWHFPSYMQKQIGIKRGNWGPELSGYLWGEAVSISLFLHFSLDNENGDNFSCYLEITMVLDFDQPTLSTPEPGVTKPLYPLAISPPPPHPSSHQTPGPGNHQLTFCLRSFASPGRFLWMKSCSMWSFQTGSFHTFLRFTHIVLFISISLIFMATQSSVVCIYRILFVHSSVDGCLDIWKSTQGQKVVKATLKNLLNWVTWVGQSVST